MLLVILLEIPTGIIVRTFVNLDTMYNTKYRYYSLTGLNFDVPIAPSLTLRLNNDVIDIVRSVENSQRLI